MADTQWSQRKQLLFTQLSTEPSNSYIKAYWTRGIRVHSCPKEETVGIHSVCSHVGQDHVCPDSVRTIMISRILGHILGNGYKRRSIHVPIATFLLTGCLHLVVTASLAVYLRYKANFTSHISRITTESLFELTLLLFSKSIILYSSLHHHLPRPLSFFYSYLWSRAKYALHASPPPISFFSTPRCAGKNSFLFPYCKPGPN